MPTFASRVLAVDGLENQAVVLRLAWQGDWPEPGPGQYLRFDAGGAIIDAYILRRGGSELSVYATGQQAEAMARLKPGASLAVSEPLGSLSDPGSEQSHRLLLCDDDGFPVLVYLTQQLSKLQPRPSILALLALQRPPFSPRPSQFVLPGMPPGVIAALPLLEDWGVASRLICADAPGCYYGEPAGLLDYWLAEGGWPAAEISATLCGGEAFVRPLAELFARHRVTHRLLLTDG